MDDRINVLDWFKNLFIPSLPEKCPVLLILDGHKLLVFLDNTLNFVISLEQMGRLNTGNMSG